MQLDFDGNRQPGKALAGTYTDEAAKCSLAGEATAARLLVCISIIAPTDVPSTCHGSLFLLRSRTSSHIGNRHREGVTSRHLRRFFRPRPGPAFEPLPPRGAIAADGSAGAAGSPAATAARSPLPTQYRSHRLLGSSDSICSSICRQQR